MSDTVEIMIMAQPTEEVDKSKVNAGTVRSAVEKEMRRRKDAPKAYGSMVAYLPLS